jgi:hypothetical protein
MVRPVAGFRWAMVRPVAGAVSAVVAAAADARCWWVPCRRATTARRSGWGQSATLVRVLRSVWAMVAPVTERSTVVVSS